MAFVRPSQSYVHARKSTTARMQLSTRRQKLGPTLIFIPKASSLKGEKPVLIEKVVNLLSKEDKFRIWKVECWELADLFMLIVSSRKCGDHNHRGNLADHVPEHQQLPFLHRRLLLVRFRSETPDLTLRKPLITSNQAHLVNVKTTHLR